MDEILTKDNSLAFTDVSEKEGIVSGYLSSFDDIPDSDNDIIRKGSYKKTLLEGVNNKGDITIKYLLDHNYQKGIGKFLELREDNKGLFYVAQLGTNFWGVDALKMIESGIITQHSIGYKPIKQFKESGVNIITEIRLWEGSALQGYAANQNTPITDLKSMQGVLDHYDRLYKALKSGTYSDETMLQIQEQHNLISEFIKTTQPTTVTVPSEDQGQKSINPEIFKQVLEAWSVKQNC